MASWPTRRSTDRAAPAPEQQWLSRNSQWNSWTGSNWNMVFVGDVNAPANSFPNPPYTTIARHP
ncbi:Exo-beta-1,3-glucanase [Streptomyces microflavus]